jgi:hypothetical protein
MHLYFLTRGIKQQRDLFVNFMTTQMFPWVRKNIKTGKDETILVQGSLRPVELWEYVFPEEQLEEVLGAMGIKTDTPTGYDTKINKTKLAVLRKMLGAEKIPIKPFKPTNRYIETRGVSIHPIGIKKDKREAVKEWGYEQEML